MFSMFSVPGGSGAVRKGLAVQQTFVEDLSMPITINRKARPSIESVAWSEAWNLDATHTYEDVEREEDLEEAERSLDQEGLSERSASEIDWPIWVKNALHEQDVSAAVQPPISPPKQEPAVQQTASVEPRAGAEVVETAITEEQDGSAPGQVGCCPLGRFRFS